MKIARRLGFSTHDSGTVKVLRKIPALSSAHGCVHECAHATVSGHLNTGWTLCEQQRELRSKSGETEKGGEKKLPVCCFMR
jgi:hypothetical protein